MNLTAEIYAAHRELSECNVAFLEFARKNPACLGRHGFDTLLSDKRFTYFRSQPWPTFINERKKKEVETAVLEVYNLIKSIIPRFFSYDFQEISSYYEIDPGMTKLLLYGVNDQYINNLVGRGDFIITPSGEFKCLEFNMQTHLGGWELDILEPLYIEIPVIARFLYESDIRIRKNHFFRILFEHVLDAFLEKHPGAGECGKTGEINMAMVFPRSNGLMQSETAIHLRNFYQPVLRQKSDVLKGDLFLCGYEALKIKDDFLVHGDRKIQILIEMCNGYVPITFMEPVRRGNLMLYNGPITRLMSNKLNLSLLSEHQDSDMFSLEEREVIKKYIPWTRKVVPEAASGMGKLNLADYILSNRDHLVLKSAEGLGGSEVFPGYSTPQEEWEQLVEKSLKERRWVVQEYVPSASYLYQHGETGCALHHAVWGFFIFGSRYAGGFVRVIPVKNSRGVINTRQGAEESIIIEVEES